MALFLRYLLSSSQWLLMYVNDLPEVSFSLKELVIKNFKETSRNTCPKDSMLLMD